MQVDQNKNENMGKVDTDKKEEIYNAFKKLPVTAKLFFWGILILIFLLFLCIYRVIPNIPALESIGIRCKCNETNSTNSYFSAMQNKFSKLQQDSIKLEIRISDAEKRIAIAERNLNNSEEDKEKLKGQLDELRKEKQELEDKFNKIKVELDITKSSLDSLEKKNKHDNEVFKDSVAYYKHETDSIKHRADSLDETNRILSNVHVTSIKADTDRKNFLNGRFINKINIHYELKGIDTLRKILNDKSFTIIFRVKNSKGDFQEFGEKNPATMSSLHIDAEDVISFSNATGNSIKKNTPFPNWQNPFNIKEHYTIQTYIKFNGQMIFIGEVIQNLKINEKVFSTDEE